MIDVHILGRLVRDPELKSVNNSNFAIFTFATDSNAKGQDGKRKPLFIEVTAWGRNADNIMQYCKKGTQLYISGVVYDEIAFIAKDGNPKSKLSVTMDKFEFTSANAKSGGNNNNNYNKPKQQQQNNNNYRDNDMDIPF